MKASFSILFFKCNSFRSFFSNSASAAGSEEPPPSLGSTGSFYSLAVSLAIVLKQCECLNVDTIHLFLSATFHI
jgi:hypothetical protein